MLACVWVDSDFGRLIEHEPGLKFFFSSFADAHQSELGVYILVICGAVVHIGGHVAVLELIKHFVEHHVEDGPILPVLVSRDFGVENVSQDELVARVDD